MLVSEQMLVVETITTRSNSFLAFKNIVAIYFMENNYLMGLLRYKKYPSAISLEKQEHLTLIENCFSYYIFFLNE